jgi:Mrp family chromosome partitioning ATPase
MSVNGQNGHGGPLWSRWISSLTKRMRNGTVDLVAYRRLAVQLHYALPRGEASRSVLVITPSNPILAAHASTLLAQSMAAELHKPVLLADVDPREPQVSRIFDATSNAGFTDLMHRAEMCVQPLVLATSAPNLSVLPVGRGPESAPQPRPDQIGPFLEAASQEHDFVVLSGGAVLSNTTALAVAPLAGSVLLLAVENKTRVADLEAAQHALAVCRVSNIGLVLTTEVRSKPAVRRAAESPGSALAHQE